MADMHKDKGSRLSTTVFKVDIGEQSNSSVIVMCYRCGGNNHGPKDCRFAKEKCYKCGKIGHVKRVCRMKPQETGHDRSRDAGKWGRGQQSRRANYLQEEDEEEQPEEAFTIYSIETPQPQVEYAKIDAKKKVAELEKSFVSLKTYTGQSVNVLGTTKVQVKHKGLTKELTAVVVAGAGPNLLGRSWLSELELSWENVSKIKDSSEWLQDILRKHETVFKEELGTLRGAKAKIHVPRDAKPRFFRARSLPFAMREKVEAELERLLKDHIIEPVKFAEWAAPVVPVVKPDGTVRLCGDYKVTINQESTLEQYPIPRLEDMFAVLAGGQKYSKLDMSHAYQQITLDENSKQYVTVNTHKGLFTYTRLPFGVSSSPAIFQRTMEGVLKGISKVTVYLDDILLTGRDDQEHLSILEQVLERLEDCGLRLKRGKCKFLEKEVNFLGHKVDATGIHPVPEKVQAVQDTMVPSSVSELKAYLGLLNFYNRFLPNLSTLLAPLHRLLKKEVKWSWKEEQEKAFKKSKELLQSNNVLVHYDEKKDLILSCDASPYGVGAVLAHRMPDGAERPIGFVSRTLSMAEKNYSQLEKEGLAVVFGVKKFHKYLYGRKFVICTDHKPLLSLLNELKVVPQMASPRIIRWAVMLGAYEYVISYRAGKDNGNADALSRFPVPVILEKEIKEEQVLMLDSLVNPLTTSEQIKYWTTRDPVLSRVREYVLKGWPDHSNSNEFAPYKQRQQELSVQDGCVLWGARIVIPEQGRSGLMEQLHQSHPGMSRMKGLARSYLWWPKLDADIEGRVKDCTVCQEQRKAPVGAPLHPWEWPRQPWRRVHMDYAGPVFGKMFFILVDAHSKWIEAYPVPSATTVMTLECLRNSFSTHGIPEMMVSDNAQCFVSEASKDFMSRNGITHVTSAPYHPSSNGLAERAVQTFKELMKKSSGNSIETKLSRALFSYRITPQTTTGLSPAEMLMGRKLRCTLDKIHPDFTSKMEGKQQVQKEHHDQHVRSRYFEVGDIVYTRNFGYGPKWVPGVIQDITGPVSYKVALGNAQVVRRHVDQLFSQQKREMMTKQFQEAQGAEPYDTGVVVSVDTEMKVPEALSSSTICEGSPMVNSRESENSQREHQRNQRTDLPRVLEMSPMVERTEPERAPSGGLRRSVRERKPPAYLKDFVTQT
ncbi:uncharacterized protein K02A2.6-like [Triplophysa dalaica]|uniref:uncharacterized protein K02A2.6-like n=1 Tax=Triplophysa dalaica TaxID=1582913 RepID=UPI0024DFBD68|nr:uncharacterized protein K02A2.6-like [Triplophysa dalaica]